MSGQTQPETALQALAEKLRTDAIAIFGEGQAERDIIEWFYGALLAAAPATPAAQGFRDGVASVANSEIPNNQDASAAQSAPAGAAESEAWLQEWARDKFTFAGRYKGSVYGNTDWALARALHSAMLAAAHQPAAQENVSAPDECNDLNHHERYRAGWNACRAAMLAAPAQPAAQAGSVYVECRQCDECGHVGINDAAEGVSACHDCEWKGSEPNHRHRCRAGHPQNHTQL